MITFVNTIKLDQKDPSDCNEVIAEGYIKEALNHKLRSIEDIVLVTSVLSLQTSGIPSKQLLLILKIDSILHKFILPLLEQDSIDRFDSIGNLSLILRIHRDLLIDSLTRESRLIAGVREQMNKALYNKLNSKAYI